MTVSVAYRVEALVDLPRSQASRAMRLEPSHPCQGAVGPRPNCWVSDSNSRRTPLQVERYNRCLEEQGVPAIVMMPCLFADVGFHFPHDFLS